MTNFLYRNVGSFREPDSDAGRPHRKEDLIRTTPSQVPSCASETKLDLGPIVKLEGVWTLWVVLSVSTYFARCRWAFSIFKTLF